MLELIVGGIIGYFIAQLRQKSKQNEIDINEVKASALKEGEPKK